LGFAHTHAPATKQAVRITHMPGDNSRTDSLTRPGSAKLIFHFLRSVKYCGAIRKWHCAPRVMCVVIQTQRLPTLAGWRAGRPTALPPPLALRNANLGNFIQFGEWPQASSFFSENRSGLT